jgi:putative photosynthetic complex assembly protein 2
MSFATDLTPWLYAAFLWWFSTGLILWLDRRPQRTFASSMIGATLIGGIACWGVAISAQQTTPQAAIIAFTCAIALWGWHEMSFLMGFVTGPRRAPCPTGAEGWRRFRAATGAIIYHEIGLALTLAALVAFTWNVPNQFATLTFALLWAMRLSAKLNLFLGAAYTGEELLPKHLTYLKTYFRRRRMNALFPLSAVGALLACGLLAGAAFSGNADAFEQMGYRLVLTLAVLGLVEHAFLFLPPPTSLLWSWAAASNTKTVSSPHKNEA